jgi:hypothetical protein
LIKAAVLEIHIVASAQGSFGSLGDQIQGGQFLPLYDRKADIALPIFLCSAAVSSIGPLYPA